MSQDNLTHWLISTRGETCFSLNPMTAATDFLKREAMIRSRLQKQWVLLAGRARSLGATFTVIVWCDR